LTTDKVSLPAVTDSTQPALMALTQALGIDRTLLASDDEIRHAWDGLPRLIERIPEKRRTALIAKLCIAIAAGLFDSAINYAWNAAILELRNRVREFGINVVPQITGRPFDERALDELKDAELLTLCLSLNLITEEAYFFLDQCRDVRNNFSSAHPAMGSLDSDEVLLFLARCGKYALSVSRNPKGIDVQGFITSVKNGRFGEDQLATWVERLRGTH